MWKELKNKYSGAFNQDGQQWGWLAWMTGRGI
jgi:hypothetical protein